MSDGARQTVSVVIPTRDRPVLLARAVRSALAQSRPPIEVIVCDDASGGHLALPPDLADDPAVRVVGCGGVGAGAARNAGVEAARGSLVAFLDDDDTWRHTKLERQLAALGSSQAVECGFDLWEDGRLVHRYVPETARDLPRILLERPVMQPSTVLVRADALRSLGGFDPRLRRVEDWELWLRFADLHDVSVVPEVLVDRAVSHPPDELEWYRELIRLLAPRLAALPDRERARIVAVHDLVEAHLLARRGERRASRAKAIAALRRRPRGFVRPCLYVVRSFVGERVWDAGKSAARSVTLRSGR